MEPEEYSEYFEDTILSRTPKSGQKGCYAKVSYSYRPSIKSVAWPLVSLVIAGIFILLK